MKPGVDRTDGSRCRPRGNQDSIVPPGLFPGDVSPTSDVGRGPDPTRRQLLAAAGVGVTAGCVDRVRSLANRDGREPVSMSIKTVPRDDDPHGIQFAQALAANLQAAGVGAEVVPMETRSFLLDVLINEDFDIYVTRADLGPDPDVLRPLLHSRFIGESGWQNPFGYANLEVDELLVRQRRQAGSARARTVNDVQAALVRTQPFGTIAVPDLVTAVRTDRFAGWAEHGVTSPLTYLSLYRTASEAEDVRVLLADARPTRNLNPLAVEFRNRGLFTGLIYESLGRWIGDHVQPWLARTWSWDAPGDEGGPVVTVTLRDGVRWHDGEPVTTDDVAFTHRFLEDTSLGEMEATVPAPRFRGRSTLVRDVEVLDGGALRLRFVPSSREVARRALTLPVLPRHDWSSTGSPVSIAGIPVAEDVPEALVRENLEPVGCGPFRVVEVVRDTAVVLERWEDHFLDSGGVRVADQFDGGGARRIEVQVVPSTAAGVGLLRAGQADAVASSLSSADIADVGRADGVGLRVRGSGSFYHIGYNNRRAPLSNPRFRAVVTRLLDRDRLVDEVFSGFASPAETPLSAGRSGEDDLPTHPFLGEAGDLDVERARAAFRDAGYQYGEDGRLVH